MDKAKVEKEYEALSPFELKDKLIAMAKSPRTKMMLNAGGVTRTGWRYSPGWPSRS